MSALGGKLPLGSAFQQSHYENDQSCQARDEKHAKSYAELEWLCFSGQRCNRPSAWDFTRTHRWYEVKCRDAHER